MEEKERARTRSTGLAGITNLSVMAPIKEGMVPTFEPISYLKRIEKVLDALHSSRQNLRESELTQSFFPDSVGKFSIFHNFRYALVPPRGRDGKVIEGGVWNLSLNVTFDGGWEPYMRVVYRDIGPLLDLLFCHNATYPTSRASFDEYCDWVRENEVKGGIFFGDSEMSVADHHYLAAVEKAGRDKTPTDDELARLALPSAVKRREQDMTRAKADPRRSLALPLRTLKGLYRLSNFFAAAEMPILQGFARSILTDSMEIMRWLDTLPAAHPGRALWDGIKTGLLDELTWLDYQNPPPVPQTPDVPVNPNALQAHILVPDLDVTHGCLVLLRVTDPAQARIHISNVLAPTCGPVPAVGIGNTIAFTYAGLDELRVHKKRLEAFPQEFFEGMEDRHAILGDVRGNHPDRWKRPVIHGQAGEQRVDMKTVHMCILMRTIVAGGAADPSPALHPSLDVAVAALDAAGTGLSVLAVEPTRSRHTGHFQFADGISQPEFHTAPRPQPGNAFNNQVSAGELLVGYANGRGDGANLELEAMLKDGTFLVVRKLRQRVDNVQELVANRTPPQQEALLSKMMGRQYNGIPLADPAQGPTGNNFNYDSKAASEACPFSAHIRRANPRDGRAYTPRILRRGMSYGPLSQVDLHTDRGVLFMAYCASIAEQFETIQRWMVGGNSSGVGSAQPDPFLRVPQEGDPYFFRYLDASGPQRENLGEKPLVQLQWGLYLFVPALKTLASLADFLVAPPSKRPSSTVIPADPLEDIRLKLEDHDQAIKEWEKVRNGGSTIQDKEYGHLVGTHKEVLAIMRDTGGTHSVKEYGRRKDLSVGLNLLGIDHANQHEELPTNAAILTIAEKDAFDLGLEKAVEAIGTRFPPLPGSPVRHPIDLMNYSDFVLAKLCEKWVGLPDEKFMKLGGRLPTNPGMARCPGNLTTASRYIFTPHPRPDVEQEGKAQGSAVLAQIKLWLKSPNPTLGPLADKIQTDLIASGAMTGPATGPGTVDADVDTLARNLAGVMVGFTPTVQGNFLNVMKNWIEDRKLWDNQRALFEQSKGATLSYTEADTALRQALFKTMCADPVPGMLYRVPNTGSPDDHAAKNRVVLGIASALTQPGAPQELIFGRDDRPLAPTATEPDAGKPTVHGCPGYKMATGVLLALIGGLLKAGTLRPTGSPVLLILTPRS